MSIKIYTISCALFFAPVVSAAHTIHKDIETTQKVIIEILQQKNPAAIDAFHDFCQQYNKTVVAFFDNNNTDSLQKHIHRMEKEHHLLKNVCDDPHFNSVRSILITYYEQVDTLISVLKKSIGSHNSLALAYKVRRFKPLLPRVIKKRGDLSLFWALHHRLTCD